MPLSEEELRLLEQMERALVEEDPKLASTLRGTSFQRAARRRMVLGGVILVAGIGLLIVAVLLDLSALLQTVVGVLGFAAMFGGVLVAVGGPGGRLRGTSARGRSFGAALRRWRRRRA